MDNLLLVGLNYRLAPVQVRERLAFSRDHLASSLQELTTRYVPGEAALLSTCNRTEIYLYAQDPVCSLSCIVDYLATHAGLSPEALSPMLSVKRGREAVEHLFRVSAGLDSLVLGEDEILGQVKSCAEAAHLAGVSGAFLSALFRQAQHTGKQVRSQTEIGGARQSVASVVVELARRQDPDLGRRTVLLIGAGKISSMTARLLVRAGLRCILVTNRTYERAYKLAETFGGQAVHFDDLADNLAQADIVISSTGAPHTVLHTRTVQSVMQQRPNRPMLIADLAVPRDVDPDVADLPGVRLVNIDALEAIVPSCSPITAEALLQAGVLVCQGVSAFESWAQERRSVPLIQALQARVSEITQAQVTKTLRHFPDATPEQQAALGLMARTIAGQMLHSSIQAIKHPPDGSDPRQVEAWVETLFGVRKP